MSRQSQSRPLMSRAGPVYRGRWCLGHLPKGPTSRKSPGKRCSKPADELGYRVNFLARGLQTRQSNLVGIVASSLDTPFRSRQVRIAAQEFISHGYRPILLTFEPDDDIEQWLSVMLNYNVAGVMVTSATPSPKIIQECHRLRMPLVLINRGKNQDIADTVQIDVQQAGELAYTMLTRSGTGRLAVVHPQVPSYSVTGRARAFVDKCHAEHVEVQEFVSANQSYQAGYDIAGSIGIALDRIDGVFCATDLLALGVMDRLRADWNVRFPDDMQIAGCDDIEQAGWGAYQLSTMRQDAEEQVLAAVQQMLDRIENPEMEIQHFNQKLTPIFRQTTLSSYD